MVDERSVGRAWRTNEASGGGVEDCLLWTWWQWCDEEREMFGGWVRKGVNKRRGRRKREIKKRSASSFARGDGLVGCPCCASETKQAKGAEESL